MASWRREAVACHLTVSTSVRLHHKYDLILLISPPQINNSFDFDQLILDSHSNLRIYLPLGENFHDLCCLLFFILG